MAEAIIDIPAMPMINEPESVNTRRHSTGKVIMSNGGVMVFSRYLRTSHGSCHDLCKYGTSCTHETESKSPRSPRPKFVTPKRAGAGRTLERTECNLGGRRKKSEVSLKFSPGLKTREPDDLVVVNIARTQGGNLTDTKKSIISAKHSGYSKPQKIDYPVVSLRPSADDLVDIKTITAEGEAQNEEIEETKLSKREKKPEVSLNLSSDSESQRAFDPDCIENEVSSWTTDTEFVPPKKVLLPLKVTDVAVAHARDLKLKPQSKLSSFQRQAYSSGKQNINGSKSKETKLVLMTPVSNGKDKGEMTIRKGIRTSVMGDKRNVVAPSVSFFPKQSSSGVSSMNAKKSKSIGVCRSKKQENAEQIKPEKSCSRNAKVSKNQMGVSCLTDQENVKKANSEEARFADIPDKTLYIIESNPESKPAESIQNNVHASDFSIMPSPSSKDKSCSKIAEGSENQKEVSHLMDQENVKRHNSEGVSFADIPGKTLYVIESNPENKPAESIQNRVHASDFSAMPFSSSKGDSKKRTPNKAPTGQPPRSCEKKNRIHRPKEIHARGSPPYLSFFPGKKGLRSTPYVLNITQPSLTSSSSSTSSNSSHSDALSQHDEVAVEKQNSSSKMMYKGRPKMALITNSKDKYLQGEKQNFRRGNLIKVPPGDCTPTGFALKQRVLIDNRNGDNREEVDRTPKRLKFRRRLLVDNRNSENQNRGEEFTPKQLKFRRTVLVHNRNGNNQTRGEEFSPRRLKFRQRVLVDNLNADNQNDSGEDNTPSKLKLRRRVLDGNKTGYIQNSEGDTSRNNSKVKDADVGRDNVTKVQFDKISLRHNVVEKKEDSRSLFNNLIEETTSRLVRTKTSKVKALVSAFESVISHLDTGISAMNNIH